MHRYIHRYAQSPSPVHMYTEKTILSTSHKCDCSPSYPKTCKQNQIKLVISNEGPQGSPLLGVIYTLV